MVSRQIWTEKIKGMEEPPGEKRLKGPGLFGLEMLGSSGLQNRESGGEGACRMLLHQILQIGRVRGHSPKVVDQFKTDKTEEFRQQVANFWTLFHRK